MRRTILAVLAVSLTAAALPVVVQAGHQPNHNPGGGGGGGGGADLTIVANPTTIIFGRSTVISGKLKAPDNVNKTVKLREDAFPYGGNGTEVATDQTDSNGNYTFTRSPDLNTRYQVTSAGRVPSARVLVLVRTRVSLFVTDRTPRVGQIVRFSGRACPTHDGLGVGIQRKYRTGFRTIRSTTLRSATRCSTYSRRVRIGRDGIFRVVTAGHSDHARGISRTVFLNAHR